jgi:hypothetical protein
MLLCAFGTAQASAQNEVSQELLELSEDQRNAAFTRLLRASDLKCDQVVRTLFAGAVLGLDDWEALCRNRNSYSLNLFAGLAFTETSLREKGRTMANETRSRQENTPSCARCGAAMRPVAHVPAFGREPQRDAFECAECGHVESFIRESRT